MPIATYILAPSGTGLSEHAWATATSSGAAWVGNNAASHITLLRSTVAEELAVGMEQRGVDRATMQRRVSEALDQWGLRAQAEQDPTTFSTGQTRRVAIASALLTRPDRLVLDCPTDGLDASAIATLRSALQCFPGEVTVYDRLRTPLFPDASTHLTLADDGSLAEFDPSHLDVPGGAGEALGTAGPAGSTISGHVPGGAGDTARQADLAGSSFLGESAGRSEASGGEALDAVAFSARDLTIDRGGSTTIGPINITARQGHVTHLAGPNGSGKTSLFLAAMGLLPYRGELTHGRCGWAPTPLDESITQRTVLKEVSLGVSQLHAEAALEFTGLQTWAHSHPLDIPATARRALIIAAALAPGPDVLLLDEPTVGLDTRGHHWLAELMRRYTQGEYPLWSADTQPAVLWTCHDAAFATAVSDAHLTL